MEGIRVTVLPDGRLSTKDAAKYLGFSVGTLAIKRQKGTGPKFVKAGKGFYFKSDLSVPTIAKAMRLLTGLSPEIVDNFYFFSKILKAPILLVAKHLKFDFIIGTIARYLEVTANVLVICLRI